MLLHICLAAASLLLPSAQLPRTALPTRSSFPRHRHSAAPLLILIDDDRSWSSPTWLWGIPGGDASQACKAMRMEFGEKSTSSRSHRMYFLETIADGDDVDWMDVELAIALAIEAAMIDERDDADWKGLLSDMVQCRFEGEEGRVNLRVALSTRLKPAPALDEPMERLAVRALEALGWPNRGL